jgi:hypothetical protein
VAAEVTPNCFIVRDANGQALSYIYYESEPGRCLAAAADRNEYRQAAGAAPQLLTRFHGVRTESLISIKYLPPPKSTNVSVGGAFGSKRHA